MEISKNNGDKHFMHLNLSKKRNNFLVLNIATESFLEGIRMAVFKYLYKEVVAVLCAPAMKNLVRFP